MGNIVAAPETPETPAEVVRAKLLRRLLPHTEKTGRADRIAFAILMLSVAAVFWRHLFTSDVLFLRDIAFSHFPRTVELRSIVRAGLLPIWNPFEHFGEPVIVNANYLLFYPTAWLAWVLPAAYGFKLHYLLHFFLLAAGSFLLARRAGLGPFACYVAGAVFALSGPLMSLGNFYNLLPAAAWMAPAILAADYQMRRGGWRGAAAFAASLTLQLFAGEPFTSIATVGLALGWVLTFFGDWRAPFWAGANRTVFLRFFSAMALTLGFSAVQVFPALWHARHTERAAQLTYLHTFFWSMHPLKFLEMLLPDFWGSPISDEGLPWLYLEGSEPYFLYSMFIGIVPLALALVGVVARRDRLSRNWAAVAVAGLVLALGRYTPFSYVFYDLVPIFRIVRFPVKFVLPATLAVAQLAALGVESLLRPAAEERPSRGLRWIGRGLLALGLVWLALSAFLWLWPEPARAVVGRLAALEFDHARALRVGQTLILTRAQMLQRATDWVVRAIPARIPYVLGAVLLLAAILLGRRREPRRSLVYAAAAAGILQLVSTHYQLNPVANPRFFRDPVPALRYVEKQETPVRVYAEPPFTLPNRMSVPFLVDLGQVDFLPSSAYVLYIYRMNLQSGAGLLGLENSFTADPEHILLEQQSLVNRLVYDRVLTGDPIGRLLRLGSVQYAFFRRLAAPGGLEHLGSGDNATTLPVEVYRVRDSLPRVYLVAVGEAVALPAGMPTVHRLFSPEFDPARQVVLEQAPKGAAREARLAGQARLLRRDALHVEVAASASQAAYLVLTDSYNPDWKVTVDGSPAPLLRANQMFRAVALPAGQHRVTFRYRPMSLVWGAAVTLATTLVALLFALREPRSNDPIAAVYSVPMVAVRTELLHL